MATRQAWVGWAVVVAVLLLGVPGYSSNPEPSRGNTGQAAEKGVSTAPLGSQAEPAEELTLDLGGAVTMKMALIRPGKFMMGKEEDPHEVTLSKPFYMGVTEVTKAQYQAIMGTNPSNLKGATRPRGRDFLERCH